MKNTKEINGEIYTVIESNNVSVDIIKPGENIYIKDNLICKNIECKNIYSGSCIKVSGDIKASGDINVSGYIKVSGHIKANNY